jgi:hypothetical protein
MAYEQYIDLTLIVSEVLYSGRTYHSGWNRRRNYRIWYYDILLDTIKNRLDYSPSNPYTVTSY